MTAKRRLTADEWAQVRRRWEGAPESGFAWLSAEILHAWGVELSRPALHKAASKGWLKGGDPSAPLTAAPSPAASLSLPASSKVTPRVTPKVTLAGASDSGSRPAISTDMVPAARAVVRQPPNEVPKPAGRTKHDDTGLTPAQEAFAALVAAGETQSAAYSQSFPASQGWRPESLHAAASRLAADAKVAARVQDLMACAARANEADVGMVLRRFLQQLNADPRELSEIRVAPCRFCHGTDHLYQYTDGELHKRRIEHEQRRQDRLEAGKRDIGAFDEQGGGGFDMKAEPHPDCPSCAGEGVARVVVKDSRKYSQAALALFIAAKEGKDGIEVKVRDGNEALLQVARHLGFFEADKDPAATVSVNYVELDQIYERAMAKSAEEAANAKGRMQRLRDRGVVVDI